MTAAADPELVAAAIHARAHAYAPYSGFPVGAAVRTDDGRVFAGVNVENAAYPEGTCAEAGAIAAMVLSGGRRIVAVAVAGGGDGPDAPLVTPCGGCRQKIREFAGPDVPILVCGPAGLRRRLTLADLLPHSFGPNNLAPAAAGRVETTP